MIRSLFCTLFVFLFPTFISKFLICLIGARRIFRIGKNCHIGFSVIIADYTKIDDNSNIGHFNIIKVRQFCIQGKIHHFNLIAGNFDFQLEDGAWINNQNKITGGRHCVNANRFVMKKNSSVITHHVFDVSNNIVIGQKSCIAGYGSQIWTHSFVFGIDRGALISKPIMIGDNCYIGSGCVICPGVVIGDNITVGAHTTLSKSITESGLYVGQSVRFIPYNADSIIDDIENNNSGYVFKR